MWVPGIELKSWGLCAKCSSCWASSSILLEYFLQDTMVETESLFFWKWLHLFLTSKRWVFWVHSPRWHFSFDYSGNLTFLSPALSFLLRSLLSGGLGYLIHCFLSFPALSLLSVMVSCGRLPYIWLMTFGLEEIPVTSFPLEFLPFLNSSSQTCTFPVLS